MDFPSLNLKSSPLSFAIFSELPILFDIDVFLLVPKTFPMRIGFLSLTSLFCLHFVAGQPEGGEGTSSAQDGGTCQSNSDKQVCFPDGSCFESLGEAVSHYHGKVNLMPLQVPKAYGEAQRVDSRDPATNEKTLEYLAKAHEYMTHLYQNETAKSFRDGCKLQHDSCAFWASIGECEAVSLAYTSWNFLASFSLF